MTDARARVCSPHVHVSQVGTICCAREHAQGSQRSITRTTSILPPYCTTALRASFDAPIYHMIIARR